MSIPETTSAEAFERYVGGKCLFASQGEAWRDIKAWLIALPPVVDALHLPAVSEPFLAWTTSGEVDFQERQGGFDVITAWQKAGRSVELHLYAQGGHGFGIRQQGTTSDLWAEQFYAWMKAQGLLGAAAK